MTVSQRALFRIKSLVSPGVFYSTLLVLGLITGLQILQTQESAAFMTALIFGAAYMGSLSLVKDPKERVIMGRIFMLGYVIRLGFTYFMFKSDMINFLGGADDLGWKGAAATAWRWRSFQPVGAYYVVPRVDPYHFPDTLKETLSSDFINSGYTYFSSLFFYRLGVNSQLALAFANCFGGALCSVVTYQVGRWVAGPRAAFVAAGATMLMPSFLIWSALTQKEVWVILIHLSGVYCMWRYAAEAGAPGMRVVVKGSSDWNARRDDDAPRHPLHPQALVWLLGVLVAVALLRTFRTYAAPMHLAAAMLSAACLFSKRPRFVAAMILLAGVLGFIFVFTIGQNFFSLNAIIEKNLSSIDSFRAGYTATFEGSRNETNIILPYDFHTLPGATMMVIVGGAYVLLSPFPWQMVSAREAFSLPDLLPWWIFFFGFILPGIVHLGRRRPALMASLLIYTAPLFLFYSLSFINVGTTYRMRSQMIPPLLLFAVATVAERRDRKKKIAARRLLRRELMAMSLNAGTGYYSEGLESRSIVGVEG